MKLEGLRNILKELKKEGFEYQIPMKELRRKLAEHKTEEWWIKQQIKLMNELGLISRTADDVIINTYMATKDKAEVEETPMQGGPASDVGEDDDPGKVQEVWDQS